MYKTPAQMVHTTPTRPRPRWCTQHQQDPGPDGAHNTNKTPAQMVHTTPTRPRPRWCTQHQQDPGPDGAHNTNKTPAQMVHTTPTRPRPRWCTQHQHVSHMYDICYLLDLNKREDDSPPGLLGSYTHCVY